MSVNKVILPLRLLRKIDIDVETGCWNWIGAMKNTGYGNSWLNGKTISAHRAVYLSLGNKIIDGLELDHLCRNRRCVNPHHLEQVTRSENAKRGDCGKHFSERNKEITHCKRGHEFNIENTRFYRGKRCCRECAKNRNR